MSNIADKRSAPLCARRYVPFWKGTLPAPRLTAADKKAYSTLGQALHGRSTSQL